MPSSGANKPTFDNLQDGLQFARTGRFYKLKACLSATHHEDLVKSVKRVPVDAKTQDPSGLKGQLQLHFALLKSSNTKLNWPKYQIQRASAMRISIALHLHGFDHSANRGFCAQRLIYC